MEILICEMDHPISSHLPISLPYTLLFFFCLIFSFLGLCASAVGSPQRIIPSGSSRRAATGVAPPSVSKSR